MTARSLLQELRRQGVTIKVEGAQLVVLGRALALTDEIVARLQAGKSELLRLLGHAEGNLGWDAADWHAYFAERAAIREYDSGITRIEAERLALEDTITQWLRLAPPPVSAPSIGCIHCGRPEQRGNPLLPLMGGRGHSQVHDWCWTGWVAARWSKACDALSNMGVCVGRLSKHATAHSDVPQAHREYRAMAVDGNDHSAIFGGGGQSLALSTALTTR